MSDFHLDFRTFATHFEFNDKLYYPQGSKSVRRCGTPAGCNSKQVVNAKGKNEFKCQKEV
jgi:hypothetical protein